MGTRVGVGIGVAVGEGVGVGTGVAVGSGVAVGAEIAVGLATRVGVGAGTGTRVAVGGGLGVAVGSGGETMDAGVEVGEGTAVGGGSVAQDKPISTNSSNGMARTVFTAGTPLQNRIVTTCHSDQNPRKAYKGAQSAPYLYSEKAFVESLWRVEYYRNPHGLSTREARQNAEKEERTGASSAASTAQDRCDAGATGKGDVRATGGP